MTPTPTSRDAAPRKARPSRSRSALTPRDALFVLFRHGRKAGATFVLIAAAATLLALALPDVYKSEAKMLVRLGRESVTLDPTATIGTTVQPIQTRKSEINSELELLRSRGLAEAVVRRLSPQHVLGRELKATLGGQAAAADPDAEYAMLSDAVVKVMEEVRAEAVPDSNILTVSYGASDPLRARDVVEAYVGEYMDLRLKVYRNPDSQNFFAEQHARSQQQLDAIQQRVRSLKDRTGLADIDTQRTILLQRIGELRKSGDEARTALAASRATVDQLGSGLGDMPESVVTSRTMNAPNSSVEALRQRLSELRIEERDVSSRYVDGSPTVVTVRAKVAEAESMLADAEKRSQQTFGLNANREAIALRLETSKAETAANVARVRRLEADLAQAEGGLGLLNETQVALDDLRRQATVAENNVRQYAKVLEEARIDTALEADKITNISLYQPAKLPLEPEGPKRKLLLIVGWLLATMAAGGVAFAAESLDHTVKRPEDLRLVGARSDNVVSIPRLTSGSAVAKTVGDHFDDFGNGLRHLFGSAGRGATRRTTSAGLAMRTAANGTASGVLGVGEVALNVVLWPHAVARAAWRRRPYLAFVRDVIEQVRWRSLRLVGRTDWGRVPTWRNLDEWRHARRMEAHMQTRAAVALDDADDFAFDAPTPRGGRIVAEHEAIQDLDDDERPTSEPNAAPQRRTRRTLALLLYGMRRDAAAWWHSDDRPNLQLTDRRHRTAAAEAVWVGARGVLEQVLLETDPDRTGRVPATLAVIGCRADSGATTIAAHFAAVLAERLRDADAEGGRVLLLSLPDSSKKVDPDASGGFEATATPVRNLMRASLPTLRTSLIRRALDATRCEYAHVVLDLPPVFADVRGTRFGEVREDAGPRLAGLCDVSVVVIEADALRREAAGEALVQLDRAEAAPTAVVLNKRLYPIPQWLYKRA